MISYEFAIWKVMFLSYLFFVIAPRMDIYELATGQIKLNKQTKYPFRAC